jgi:hypothetical protein
MRILFDGAPLLVLAVSFMGLWLAAMLGVVCQKVWSPVKAGDQNEFNIVQSAALTLLGLIVAFSFSMAVTRYDQRKNLEEAEANAIGTEYVRTDLMPQNSAAATRDLLKQYLNRRIQFYETTDKVRLETIAAETSALGADLWSSARSAAAAQPTALTSLLVASGMNDVLNAADFTTAAWLNRIPITGWWLMFAIGAGCNITLGFGARRFNSFLLLVLPLTIGVAFFLIADIDSPRSGLVNVVPENLIRLATSLNPP